MANSTEAACGSPPASSADEANPLVSIVVLNYNNREALRRNLLALRALDYANRHTEPVHFNIPIWRKLVSRISKRFEPSRNRSGPNAQP